MNHATVTFGAWPKKRSAISLTPLIDVVFILLLFFMLSSTFANMYALDVTASSSGASDVKPDAQPIIIRVIDGERWRVKQTVLSYSNSANPLLQKAISNNAPILVHAETSATVQDLVSTLSYLEQQGVKNLHVGESAGEQ